MNQLPICTQTRPEQPFRQGLFVNDAPVQSLNGALARFAPIGLRDIESVALLNRIDTKFVLSTSQLLAALERLKNYRILAIGNRRIHHYRTLYYDTSRFDFYHDQVTGRADIFKVRSRDYTDTRSSFLEVKYKNHKERTDKSRLAIPYNWQGLDAEADKFLKGLISVDSRKLEPKLWNIFSRITLVSKTNAERLTIDVDLSFANDQGSLSLSNIAIAEVKQNQFSFASSFLAEMRYQGIRKTGFSKYCYGVAQLTPGVKKNTQKERILMVEKIRNRGNHDCYA
ncbi:MAG: polyphosphate polymerase domain-containing protein [Anaerolineaceae bacterium]|nr:polyphosphate polymerase domain-containing protein [Anaerolineaceae bacterium]